MPVSRRCGAGDLVAGVLADPGETPTGDKIAGATCKPTRAGRW